MSLKSLKKVYKRRPKKNLNQMNIIHGIIFVMIFFFFYASEIISVLGRNLIPHVWLSFRSTLKWPLKWPITLGPRPPLGFASTQSKVVFSRKQDFSQRAMRKHKTGVAHANQTVSRAQWLLSARGCWVLNVKFTRKGFNCTREMKLFAWFICFGINIIP